MQTLQLAQPWHVCVKTNKHNQRIYGPSVALVEESIRLSDKSMIHLTGLGLTKSLQEFLVLQYYATDSASSWHSLLQDWFPQVNWMPPGRLRHRVRELYKTLHIAPSHRRMPHPCWTGPMISAGSFVGLSLLHLSWQWDNIHAGGVLGAICFTTTLTGYVCGGPLMGILLPAAQCTSVVTGDWSTTWEGPRAQLQPLA